MSATGFVGSLTPEQEDALQRFRTAIGDLAEVTDKDDHYFLRWLRARKFDVAKAEDMLRKHIETRKKFELDAIILTNYNPPEVLQRFFPGGAMGEDREGNPVWYDNFNLDFKGLHYSVKLDDILKTCLYRAEMCLKLCEEASAKKGRRIDTITFVVDYEKLSLQRHYYWPGIQMMRKIMTTLESNYPEITKRALLIRLPSIFPLCFNMVKYILDENMQAKIFLLGSDYKEVLQKYISPDQLPMAYGGTRCEPDPYCTKYVNPGGDIPEEYYLSNLMEKGKEDMKRVVVGQGSTHLITHSVTTPGTILRWEFMSTDHDIGYGWFYKQENKKEEVELVPIKRRKSQVIPVSGVHTCEHPGEYLLKFDNTYSWVRSKEVFYSVKVVPPESELSEATPTKTEATPIQTNDSSSVVQDSVEIPSENVNIHTS